MLKLRQPRKSLVKASAQRLDVGLQRASQRVRAALQVVQEGSKSHTLWPTRPFPNHAFADRMLLAPKHAKNRGVPVGLPTRIDLVLEVSKLARFFVGPQVDELDLSPNKLGPRKVLSNDKQRVVDRIGSCALVAAG
jgi:hypothetical protein